MYLVGLMLGSVLLVTSVAFVGSLLQPLLGDSVALAAIAALAITAAIGAMAGPNVLPARRWAVPRHWTNRSGGKAAFGLLRGVGVLTYSPHASFHAWLVLILLSPATIALSSALTFALGLFAQSVVYTAIALRSHPGIAGDAFQRWGQLALINQRTASVVDATGLAAMAAALLVWTTR